MIRHFLSLTFLLLFSASLSDAANIVAGRTTGTAPLLVNFYDSDATASTGINGIFHSQEYTWTYDDTGAGTWGTSGLSKNTDKGPTAAHVYETAGTYTVSLSVKNSSGDVIGTDTEIIVVTDPATTYAGTLTTCLNKVGDSTWTDCPSGANHVNADSLSATAVINSAETGERLLLKRGSSWTLSATPAWPASSRVTISAYGACTTPDELGICSNDPAIAAGTYGLIDMSSHRDMKLINLTLTGSAEVSNGNIYDFDQFLHLRVSVSNADNAGIGWGHWNNANGNIRDQLGVVSCRIYNSTDYGLYVGGERLALLGNIFDRSGTTHLTRVWQMYRGVIEHNIFSSADLDNANGRHAIKFTGPDDVYENPEHCAETNNTACLRSYTSLSVVSNNIFGTSGPYPVNIAPQSSAADTQITDIIFEKNKIIADYGTIRTAVTRSLLLVGRYITVRNNIIDGSDGQTDYRGIILEGTTTYPLVPGGLGYHMIYNNNIYRHDTPYDIVIGIELESGANNNHIRNNLISFPNASGSIAATLNNGTGNTLSNNIYTTTAYFVDANNATPLSRNFNLTVSSTEAINQGYAVGILDDYAGIARTGTNDVGAYNYTPGVVAISGVTCKGCTIH